MWLQINRVSSVELCESKESIPKLHPNEILLMYHTLHSLCKIYVYTTKANLASTLKKKKKINELGPP